MCLQITQAPRITTELNPFQPWPSTRWKEATSLRRLSLSTVQAPVALQPSEAPPKIVVQRCKKK
jgi:hypothetical protein